MFFRNEAEMGSSVTRQPGSITFEFALRLGQLQPQPAATTAMMQQ